MLQSAIEQPGLKKQFNFSDRLKEIGLFFQKKDPVHKTMFRLVEKLKKANIPYAIMGAMAVNAHGQRRTTDDVDVLLTQSGFDQFVRRCVPRAYEKMAGRPRRFLDRRHGVTFDVLITGYYPGTGKPGPISFPDPADVNEVIEEVQVVDLVTLIQLKLAAGRHYDFGDVANLIRIHELDEAFLKNLHPSVHQGFIECLEEKRREDEYEARQTKQLEEIEREDRYESSEE